MPSDVIPLIPLPCLPCTSPQKGSQWHCWKPHLQTPEALASQGVCMPQLLDFVQDVWNPSPNRTVPLEMSHPPHPHSDSCWAHVLQKQPASHAQVQRLRPPPGNLSGVPGIWPLICHVVAAALVPPRAALQPPQPWDSPPLLPRLPGQHFWFSGSSDRFHLVCIDFFNPKFCFVLLWHLESRL